MHNLLNLIIVSTVYLAGEDVNKPALFERDATMQCVSKFILVGFYDNTLHCQWAPINIAVDHFQGQRNIVY